MFSREQKEYIIVAGLALADGASGLGTLLAGTGERLYVSSYRTL